MFLSSLLRLVSLLMTQKRCKKINGYNKADKSNDNPMGQVSSYVNELHISF